MDIRISRIYLDKRTVSTALAQKILSALPQVTPMVDHKDTLLEQLLAESLPGGKRTLFITLDDGEMVRPCPGTTAPYLCCRYSVITITEQCPMDCTYCILQQYLWERPVLTVYANPERALNQVDCLLSDHPGRFFRFGTGELADSLALESLTGQAADLIKFFALRKNCLLELKTKSDRIESLLSLKTPGNIVVSWSLNPPKVIRVMEKGSATMEERLQAARACQERDYLLGFHFDPLLLVEDWENDYESVVESLFQVVDPARVAWISLGALRFPPSLWDIMRTRFPDSPILNGEFIRGLDGKMRYPRPLRLKLFHHLTRQIRRRAPDILLYFCMEPPWVWQEVLGFAPASNAEVDLLFARSLAHRFPQLHIEPIETHAYHQSW